MSTTDSRTKSAKWVESFKLRLSPELYEQAEQARREESQRVADHAARAAPLSRRGEAMRAPNWAKGEDPKLLDILGEKMSTDVRQTRLNLRGVGHLPLDRDRARVELSEKERARRASRPKTRRFRQLEKRDSEIDRLSLRLTEATRALGDAEARLTTAPDDDARSLADWLAGGEKGSGQKRACTNARAIAMRPSFT
jgi:hypothetical protein